MEKDEEKSAGIIQESPQVSIIRNSLSSENEHTFEVKAPRKERPKPTILASDDESVVEEKEATSSSVKPPSQVIETSSNENEDVVQQIDNSRHTNESSSEKGEKEKFAKQRSRPSEFESETDSSPTSALTSSNSSSSGSSLIEKKSDFESETDSSLKSSSNSSSSASSSLVQKKPTIKNVFKSSDDDDNDDDDDDDDDNDNEPGQQAADNSITIDDSIIENKPTKPVYTIDDDDLESSFRKHVSLKPQPAPVAKPVVNPVVVNNQNRPAMVSKKLEESDDDIIDITEDFTNNQTFSSVRPAYNYESPMRVKKEEKPISPWGANPKYEDDKSKLKSITDKIKERQVVKNEIKLIETKPNVSSLNNKPSTSTAAAAASHNPLADLRFDATMQRAPTTQIYNRNLGFEDKLNVLRENMIEVMVKKPDPDDSIANFKPPTGLRVKLLPHQIYSMRWLKWRENTYPNGSILADDMGLGKTLTVLAYLKLVKVKRTNSLNLNSKKVN